MTGLMSEITTLGVAGLIGNGDTYVGAYFAIPVAALAAFWSGRRLVGIARSFFGG